MKMRIFTVLAIILVACFAIGCDKVLYGEATNFAPGFSEAKFKQVKLGAGINEVLNLAVKPMLVVTQEWYEVWFYPFTPPESNTPPNREFYKHPYLIFYEDGKVSYVSKSYLSQALRGLTKAEVTKLAGLPVTQSVRPFEIVFHYSEANRIKGNGTYKKRIVRFGADHRVSSIDSQVYYD